MLDFDHFKAINDTHGHLVGDLVLRESAKICRLNLRTSDLLGRVGGEEFAILLPHTGPQAAMKVAEKLRSAIAHQRIPAPSGRVTMSASFGIASLDRAVRGLDDLLERADSALYEAKADGRNRCVAWGKPAAATITPVRRRVLKAGRVSFNLGHSTIDCTVRSLSETGAGIDVISTAGIPDHFRLQIESDNLYRHCRLIEKKDRHMEVEFEPAMAVAA